jgi:hypothetical protein
MNIKRYANFESRIVNIRYLVEYRNFSLPSSQREKEWVNEQNSKFILSILENKPLGSLILNKKNNKTYILDGQHRINALELFIKNKIFLMINNDKIYYDDLTEEMKIDFNDTEIFIREYNNLTDDEMADIIDSINEGIKNDNINSNSNLNTTLIEQLSNEMSIIIYNKKYLELKEENKNNLMKYIGYIGTIINNFDTSYTNNDYIKLNLHHVKRFFNNLKKNSDELNIDIIIKFTKIIYSNLLMKNDEILEAIDKYDLNNSSLNCIYYKLYSLYINNLINSNEKHIKNIIIEILKIHKNNFKELLDIFDTLYYKINLI